MQKKPQSSKESTNFITLLNFIADPAVIVDDKGRFLAVNDAFEKITGLCKKNVINLPFFKVEILSAESKRLLLKKLKKRMRGSTATEPYEITFSDKNGEKRYSEVKAKKITCAGHPADLVLFHDVTRRKRNERRLKEYSERMEALVNEKIREIKESEEKFRNLSEESPNMIFINKLGRVVYANKKCEDLMGYTKEEFYAPTFNFFNLIAPGSLRTLNASYRRHLAGEEVESYEYTLVTKVGEKINAVIATKLIAYEGAKAILGIVTDITEQKKIENELRMERDKLEAVTENIGAGLAIINKDYSIRWVNKFLKQINGDCEGKRCYSTFNKITSVCPDCGVKKVFESGVPIDIHEYSNLDAKGNRYWIELIVTPIKDENGNVTAALELAVNITERKIMQNKLAEYSQKLEKLVEKRTEQLRQTQAKLVKSERLAAIGELAAMVGHDLRNPLTGIKGAAYYLNIKYHGEINHIGKVMLKTIDECIEQSNRIINDLLEYSRDLKLELSETNPKALFAQSMSMLKVPKKIQVINETEDNPPIKVDVSRMNRVLLNILQNAVDAMSDGGTLTLASKTVKDTVQISITDTGIGMSKKTINKLWTPLFTTKAKGMGFGLSICKRVVEAHKGEISVESRIGKGSTFIVAIPLYPKPADEAETLVLSEPALSASTQVQESP